MAFGRQDLIRLAKKTVDPKNAASGSVYGIDGIEDATPSALPYLTHFTRDSNAPSWGPTQNSTDLGGNATYPYKDNADSATAVNRSIPGVRAVANYTVTSYNPNGSAYSYAVRSGDPLIQRRFPLGRLNWLGKNGVQNGGTAASVQACFGLQWDANNLRWVYTGSVGNTIQTAIAKLDTVATEKREPNYFELLKAGILNGSVGMVTARVVDSGDVKSFNDLPPYQASGTDIQQDRHVVQIGANIVDQYDTDSYPTRIYFRDYEFYGVENIPYIYRLSMIPYRPAAPYTGGGAIPADLFEAAEIDGASHFQQMVIIVLPLSGSILGTVGVMRFLAEWNEFILPLVVIRDADRLPVMVALLRLAGEYIKFWGPLMAGYAMASLPIIILFVFSMKLFVRGMTDGAVKG